MTKNYKYNSTAVELIWQQTHSLQDAIRLLYEIDHEDRTLEDLQTSDPEMYDFYYQLNDMALKLSDRGVMKFQQEKH